MTKNQVLKKNVSFKFPNTNPLHASMVRKHVIIKNSTACEIIYGCSAVSVNELDWFIN